MLFSFPHPHSYPMIQLTTSGEESRLTLHEGSEELGHISFRVLPETSIAVAEHTRVSPEHQGKGIAAKLAASFFEHCKKEGLLVRPVCSYIVAYMERHPELEVLRAPEEA